MNKKNKIKKTSSVDLSQIPTDVLEMAIKKKEEEEKIGTIIYNPN